MMRVMARRTSWPQEELGWLEGKCGKCGIAGEAERPSRYPREVCNAISFSIYPLFEHLFYHVFAEKELTEHFVFACLVSVV